MGKKQTLCAKNTGMGRATPRGSQASEHWTNLVFYLVRALFAVGEGGWPLPYKTAPVCLAVCGIVRGVWAYLLGICGGKGCMNHHLGLGGCNLNPSGLGLFGGLSVWVFCVLRDVHADVAERGPNLYKCAPLDICVYRQDKTTLP